MKQNVAQRYPTLQRQDFCYHLQSQPRFIGGVVVQYPDRILDGLLARKVQDLGKRTSAAV